MAGLTTAERVVALLEWGDMAEADAEIAAAGAGWQPSLWLAMRALMEGRFHACERLAAEAAARGRGEARAAALVQILVATLRRDQERLAEAEILARAAPGADALLALLVGEMGRDGLARQELTRLLSEDDPVTTPRRLARLCLLAHLAAAVDAPEDTLAVLHRRLQPHAGDFAFEEGGAAFYGAVAYALGRLAQALGRATEAIGHYEDAIDAQRASGRPSRWRRPSATWPPCCARAGRTASGSAPSPSCGRRRRSTAAFPSTGGRRTRRRSSPGARGTPTASGALRSSAPWATRGLSAPSTTRCACATPGACGTSPGSLPPPASPCT